MKTNRPEGFVHTRQETELDRFKRAGLTSSDHVIGVTCHDIQSYSSNQNGFEVQNQTTNLTNDTKDGM